jgi:hypothetical protein
MASTALESRMAAFHGGATGTGLNHATSLQQNVDPNFHPHSILAMTNELATGNGEAKTTFGKTDPYANAMQSQLKQDAAGGGNGVMNV